MKSLVIGSGEIGTSLNNIIDQDIRDKAVIVNDTSYDIIHICFPFSKTFIKDVKDYQKEYNPKYTVIHSTVPVGTSRKLKAIHSPCLGIHPHLEESMLTFKKFIGGGDTNLIQWFRRLGFKVQPFDNPETTELMKILSTTKYGLDITFNQEVKELCDTYKVPFEAWTLWTNNYNTGYEKLGYEEYKRPNLIYMKGNIGGHCVLNNLKLLNTKWKLMKKYFRK
jgi:hypothetical protein